MSRRGARADKNRLAFYAVSVLFASLGMLVVGAWLDPERAREGRETVADSELEAMFAPAAGGNRSDISPTEETKRFSLRGRMRQRAEQAERE